MKQNTEHNRIQNTDHRTQMIELTNRKTNKQTNEEKKVTVNSV